MRTLLGLLPALLFLAGCAEKQPYTKPLTTVKVEAVETYRADQAEQYSGNIEPLTRVDVAFRLGGYVEDILEVPEGGSAHRLVQEGDRVAKGVTLVKLRQTDYTVKVDQAQSQLDQAGFAIAQAEESVKGYRAALEKAKLDQDRATHLYSTQSLTKPDLDGAQAQLDSAQAQVDGAEAQVKLGQARLAGAKAQLEEAQLAVRDTSLKSPIDGVVLKRMVEVGSLVAPGTPAFVIGDVRQVKSVFGVPDTVLPHLRLGMSLPVTSEGVPGAIYNGHITSIAPTADPRSRIFEVELTVPNSDGRLKPGMIASMSIAGTAKTEPIPVVPLNAVVQPPPGQSGYMVYVLDEEGGKATVKSRAVELGDALGERIAVKSGLRGGERVVVTGASMVHDGQTVEVVP
jgi:multidrug efflux system membrane fusion protein